MPKTLKIVVPTAGLGTRMYPQTWSKPKPLVSVAGQAALDHLLAAFVSLPADVEVEYVFIVGPGLGETCIPAFMKEHHPDYKVHYALQLEMKGQSDAFWSAREYLSGPIITCFSDTLIETDFSSLARGEGGGVAWVKAVPDPRRFGVAEVNDQGWVTRLIEKPDSVENNLAVVGCYYFPEGRDLVSAIQEQVERGVSLRGEYFLADAINILLEHGMKMRTQNVDVWLDTGTIEATLETNRYLLEHGRANKTKSERRNGLEIVPPVFIHETVQVSNSVIGPHVSIGPECKISNACIADSILEAEVTIEGAALKGSFIGQQARVEGHSASSPSMTLNIGDNSSVILE
jgi:glucose-1-phosphate thymidylyltransferase